MHLQVRHESLRMPCCLVMIPLGHANLADQLKLGVVSYLAKISFSARFLSSLTTCLCGPPRSIGPAIDKLPTFRLKFFLARFLVLGYPFLPERPLAVLARLHVLLLSVARPSHIPSSPPRPCSIRTFSIVLWLVLRAACDGATRTGSRQGPMGTNVVGMRSK